MNAIVAGFAKKTPGKRTISVEEENKQLKEQLRNMYHNKHNIAQEASDTIAEPTPVICYQCGNSHIKKNGTVLSKKDGLRQRYTCQSCTVSFYLAVKKTLIQSN